MSGPPAGPGAAPPPAGAADDPPGGEPAEGEPAEDEEEEEEPGPAPPSIPPTAEAVPPGAYPVPVAPPGPVPEPRGVWEAPAAAEPPPPQPLPRPRPLIGGPAALLAALVTAAFLMFLLTEPTQPWIALLGAGVAALGADGVLRHARPRAVEAGADTTPHLILPALYALALPPFAEQNAHGYWAPLAGLAAGAGFLAVVAAEAHSLRAREPRQGAARFVAGAATYLVAFAAFSLAYDAGLDLAQALAAVALVSWLLAIGLLRESHADPIDTLILAAVVALVVVQLRWALRFVPLEGPLAATALLIAFHFASGVLHAHLAHRLGRGALAGHVLIAAAGGALVVGARLAGLA